ncbi:hypothetical protein EVAR_8829_1 [Eumeta japonica]|uniref:Uncharacterized protein n=1 Tax=Eumeta variegata TaxID=151549 RepID=A0A4C1TTY6_EUMVA|nr:hypothetical protein EVAR_8829_1 [Eumeta japonica]
MLKAGIPRLLSPLEVFPTSRPNSVVVTEMGIVEGNRERKYRAPSRPNCASSSRFLIPIFEGLGVGVILSPPADYCVLRSEGSCSSYGCYRHPARGTRRPVVLPRWAHNVPSLPGSSVTRPLFGCHSTTRITARFSHFPWNFVEKSRFLLEKLHKLVEGWQDSRTAAVPLFEPRF